MAESSGLAALRAPLNELLRLHYRYRFDPMGLNEADRETRRCLEKLSAAGEMVAVGN